MKLIILYAVILMRVCIHAEDLKISQFVCTYEMTQPPCFWGVLLKFLGTFKFGLKADKVADISHEVVYALLRMSRLCFDK
jgi:hypothetical protein